MGVTRRNIRSLRMGVLLGVFSLLSLGAFQGAIAGPKDKDGKGGVAPSPIKSAPAPVRSAPAPVKSAPPPVRATPAPVKNTPAPTPVRNSPAPVKTNPAPVVPTKPVEQVRRPQPAQPPQKPIENSKPNPGTDRGQQDHTRRDGMNRRDQSADTNRGNDNRNRDGMNHGGNGQNNGRNGSDHSQQTNRGNQNHGDYSRRGDSHQGSGYQRHDNPVARHVDPIHRQHYDSSRQRMEHMVSDRELRERVDRRREEFRRNYCDRITIRSNVYINNFSSCHDWYSGYHRYGFRGGYYYDYTPVHDVTVYFANPLWAFFYMPVIDDGCYRAWYGADYNRYRVAPFRHVRVFHPTVEFRQLVLGVSDLDAYSQSQFREGMEFLTDKLGQKLANLTGTSVALDEDDVVVNNYQVLQNAAVVVEGYVDHSGTRFAFKGLVDLRFTANTMLFVPANPYGDPSYDEIDTLQRMNNRILDLGGTVARD